MAAGSPQPYRRPRDPERGSHYKGRGRRRGAATRCPPLAPPRQSTGCSPGPHLSPLTSHLSPLTSHLCRRSPTCPSFETPEASSGKPGPNSPGYNLVRASRLSSLLYRETDKSDTHPGFQPWVLSFHTARPRKNMKTPRTP